MTESSGLITTKSFYNASINHSVDIKCICSLWVRKAEKKIFFLIAWPLRPYSHPSSLMAVETFFKLKKALFSLMTGPLPSHPPPVWMARPLKRTFFTASLRGDVKNGTVRKPLPRRNKGNPGPTEPGSWPLDQKFSVKTFNGKSNRYLLYIHFREKTIYTNLLPF